MCIPVYVLQRRVEKLMALYDKKTDRINKTRARVTRARRGASKDAVSGSPDALPSSAAAGAGFAIHSALDDVHCEDVDSDGEERSYDRRFDGAQVADQVAECEDEIDRMKQRHDTEVEALRAQVRCLFISLFVCLLATAGVCVCVVFL